MLLSSLNMVNFLVEEVSLALLSDSDIVLQTVLHEKPSSDGIDSLTVHLFYVFDVRANGDFISRLDKSDVGDDSHMSHLFNGVGDLSLHGRAKACLVPVVKLSSIVKEFHHHWRVLPVDFALVNGSHVLFADLGSSERAVDEHRGSLLIVLGKVLLFPLD